MPHMFSRLLPFLSPLLVWLAFPGGGGVWPLLFVALVPLFLSLYQVTGWKALRLGYTVGLVFYGLQLYWLVTVLSKYGGLPVFIAVPALFLLISYMALYLMVFCCCARLILQRGNPLVSLLGLPAAWVGLDWLRSFLFSGFPWMDLGYGLAGVPQLIQTADLFGHSFSTFLVVAVNCCILLVIDRAEWRRAPAVPVVLTLLLLGGTVLYGKVREEHIAGASGPEKVDTLTVGVVQGNIDQSLKWSAEQQRKTVDVYLGESRKLIEELGVELVVWPETALPFYPSVYPDVGRFYRGLEENDIGVLTGVPWYEIVNVEKRQIDYFNSAQLYSSNVEILGSYYKSHLVPFGEYVPLKRFLPFLAPLVEAVGDFSPGTVETTLDYGGARMGVLICFESIFSEIGRKWVENGANVLVNLTNDAWYGKSSAPYHSMSMTVFRAVETRRAVVRAANTGISGFIAPTGRVSEASPIFVDWRGGRKVPLFEERTVFVRWGYLFAPLCFVVAVGLITVILRRKA